MISVATNSGDETVAQERSIKAPRPALPQRVVLRPGPPPSGQSPSPAKKVALATKLPVAPRPLISPPIQPRGETARTANLLKLPIRSRRFAVRVALAATALSALILATALAMTLTRNAGAIISGAKQAERAGIKISTAEVTSDTVEADDQRATAETASSSLRSDLSWDALLGEVTAETEGHSRPTAEQLLASRFYELTFGPTGEVVAAAMPRDGRRYGPAPDELAALLNLTALEKLDLGDTIASVAVPIANRMPHLKVLTLHNQSNSAGFQRLVDIEELRLVDSNADPVELANLPVKVSYTH